MRSILITFALLFITTAAFADRQVSHQFHSEAPASGVKRVVIDIPSGSITVRNGVADSLRVFGVARREYDDTPQHDQKIVDDTGIEIYASSDEAIVRRRFGANAQGWRAQRFTSFDLTVEVPKGTTVKFETSYGSVDINGSFGDVDVAMRGGTVTFTTPRADVRTLSTACRIGELTTNFGEEVVQKQGILPSSMNYFNAEGRTNVHVHATTGSVFVSLTK